MLPYETALLNGLETVSLASLIISGAVSTLRLPLSGVTTSVTIDYHESDSDGHRSRTGAATLSAPASGILRRMPVTVTYCC